MGINISLEDTKIGGNAKILNETVIGESTEIEIRFKNTEIQKGVELLTKTEIAKAVNTAEKNLPTDSEEFKALEKIKNNKSMDVQSIRKAVLHHIATFATGTLANILSSYIMMK